MYLLEVSTDDFDDGPGPVRRTVATYRLQPHEEHSGLYEIPGHPVQVRIDDALTIDLICERVGDGSMNFSICHNGRLMSAGKYYGPFTVRMFTEGGSTYVVDVREDD